jgi:hypothetical protein
MSGALTNLMNHSRWVLMVIGVFLAITSGANAVAQDSGDLAGGSDDVQIIFACYGQGDHFVDVTSWVSKLLPQESFAPHADVLNIDAQPSSSDSLLILYNYAGNRHLFVRGESGGKISPGLLKEEAKLDGAHGDPASTEIKGIGEPEVVFAAYGVHASFADVTESFRKQLMDNPDGFSPGSGAFNADPEYGSSKSTILVYDFGGKRRIYTIKEGNKISVAFLKALTATP